MSKRWFVLQYKPNSHHIAARNLNQQGHETFLPLVEITTRKMSRFVSITRPLFPGYMFIKFDSTKAEWHKINNTHGVSRLVTFNTILKPIQNEVIEYLKKRVDLSGKILPVKKYKKGDQVKILKGPFSNFISTVETYETNQRIWILMDLMGRKTKIQALAKNLQLSS
jgi:transcriptional antiterminator RfaH